jgi:uncharacterized PurR-regulated membrane protein YhhQ (DUF165 family)
MVGAMLVAGMLTSFGAIILSVVFYFTVLRAAGRRTRNKVIWLGLVITALATIALLVIFRTDLINHLVFSPQSG